jgi:hypothetical protein
MRHYLTWFQGEDIFWGTPLFMDFDVFGVLVLVITDMRSQATFHNRPSVLWDDDTEGGGIQWILNFHDFKEIWILSIYWEFY